MLKIGIIGPNSFLAKRLINHLANENFRLFTFGRDQANSFRFDYPLHPIETKDLVELDYVLYFAGAGIQPRDNSPLSTLYGVNAFEPVRIISELRSGNFSGTFISFGSYFEIGKQGPSKMFKEEEVVLSENAPLNNYGIAKRMLSRFVHDFISRENFSLLHFILPNIYGKGENEERLIPYLVKQVKACQPIQLSSGYQVRQYLHADDIAFFISRLILQRDVFSGIYNLGSKDVISIKNLVEEVIKCARNMNFEIPEINFGEIVKRDEGAVYLELDDSLAKEKLGWSQRSLLNQNLKTYF